MIVISVLEYNYYSSIVTISIPLQGKSIHLMRYIICCARKYLFVEPSHSCAAAKYFLLVHHSRMDASVLEKRS